MRVVSATDAIQRLSTAWIGILKLVIHAAAGVVSATDAQEPYNTANEQSFAHVSVKERWPVILTSAIDDVHRTISATQDAAKRDEGKSIVENLAKLKFEIQHNRPLSPLEDDGVHDVATYNAELAQLANPTWFNVPWLFSECYLYRYSTVHLRSNRRRVATLFTNTKHWAAYDIFQRQKETTFKSSRPAVIELAARYRKLIEDLGKKKGGIDETAERAIFDEMLEICLWGNATDLSLLTNLSYEDIQKLQGSKAREAAEANILVNDLGNAFQLLNDLRKVDPDIGIRVDIVLDNAGFELYADLLLAGYLIAAGLASHVVLHPKSIPWFVSDVIPKDFGDLLNALCDPQTFYAEIEENQGSSTAQDSSLRQEELDDLNFVFNHWSSLHADGQLIIRFNRFWTLPGSYWRLPKSEPDLYEDLRESELVVFKGDLNYRKLVGDAAWAPTTPFAEAIGPLGDKTTGLRVLALRTCKADTVVGLPEGVDEKLRASDGGGGDSGARKWAWSGKWAMAQFHDGRS